MFNFLFSLHEIHLFYLSLVTESRLGYVLTKLPNGNATHNKLDYWFNDVICTKQNHEVFFRMIIQKNYILQETFFCKSKLNNQWIKLKLIPNFFSNVLYIFKKTYHRIFLKSSTNFLFKMWLEASETKWDNFIWNIIVGLINFFIQSVMLEL